MTIGISVFGSGRIGVIHARNVARAAGARLVSIMNPNRALAQPLAEELGVPVVASAQEALSDPAVHAVIICTPTSTHVELIEEAARAGRAIMCEKPLDLAIERVDRAMAVLEETGVPFMLSFNRRFDPGVAALRSAVEAGEVGDLNMLSLTSRDPAPPPIAYVRQSGGYFADSTIHEHRPCLLDHRRVARRSLCDRLLPRRPGDRRGGRLRHRYDHPENALGRTRSHQQFAPRGLRF